MTDTPDQLVKLAYEMCEADDGSAAASCACKIDGYGPCGFYASMARVAARTVLGWPVTEGMTGACMETGGEPYTGPSARIWAEAFRTMAAAKLKELGL